MNPVVALIFLLLLMANVFYGLEDHIGRPDAVSLAVAAGIATTLIAIRT